MTVNKNDSLVKIKKMKLVILMKRGAISRFVAFHTVLFT